MSRRHVIAPYVAVSLAVLFWGLSFVATKIALTSFSTFTLLFIRFIAAASFFLAIVLWRGFPRLTPKEHGQVFLAALLQPGLYFICETLGLQYTSASKASLIIAAIPIVVLWLSVAVLKERATMPGLIGVGLSLLGIALLITGDPQWRWQWDGSRLGDVLILGAVLAMAAYTVLLKKIAPTCSPVDLTGLQMGYGALFFAPAFLWEFPQMQWASISSRSLLALGGLILFATISAFLCFNYALARLTASQAALFLNCVPVVTATGAWLMLGERLTLLQFTGGGLVLCAVYLANFSGNLKLAATPEVAASLGN